MECFGHTDRDSLLPGGHRSFDTIARPFAEHHPRLVSVVVLEEEILVGHRQK